MLTRVTPSTVDDQAAFAPGLVLVTGATGKTGRNLVAELEKNRVPHRAASRQSKVPFDWTDLTTWDHALDGASAAYLVAPGTVSDPYSRVIEFLEHAVTRGMQRFVFLSISSLPAGDLAHGRVHQWLQNNTADWAVLRPSAFMQNFSEGPFYASIREEDRIYSNTGTGRVAFIDARDIARAAYAALAAPVALNADFVLTGDEPLTFDEVAETISAATGRMITHTNISTDEFASRFQRRGIPELTAQLLAAGYSTIANGTEDYTTDALGQLTRQPATTFRAFARAHAHVWKLS
jgi:uncharacterized protein YbjT (DUF2867 family)